MKTNADSDGQQGRVRSQHHFLRAGPARSRWTFAAGAAAAVMWVLSASCAHAVYFSESFDEFTNATSTLLVGGVGSNHWYQGSLTGTDPRSAGGSYSDGGTTYTPANPPPGFSANSGWSVSSANLGSGYNSSGAMLSQSIATSTNPSDFQVSFKFRQDIANSAIQYYGQGVGIYADGFVSNNVIQAPSGSPAIMLYVNPSQYGQPNNAFIVSTPDYINYWWSPSYNYAYYQAGSYATGITYQVRLHVKRDGTSANDLLWASYQAYDPGTSTWGTWQNITPGYVTTGVNLDNLNLNSIQVMGGDWWGGFVMDDFLVVPEPSALVLITAGGLLLWRRMHSHRSQPRQR